MLSSNVLASEVYAKQPDFSETKLEPQLQIAQI